MPELGSGTEGHHIGQEQRRRGVQAVGGQDLVNQQQVQQVVVPKGDPVAHDEGLAPLILGQQRFKRLQVTW